MENQINRYKLVKRKQNNTKDENTQQTPIINIPELTTRIKRSLYADIDARAKYWMEQRIGLLLNNNALMKKNTTELKIDYDNNSGGLAWLFKYNGSTVAYIDYRGYLYCSNILLNGVNLLNAINNIININNDLSKLSDIYVRHVDLKNGTYVLNVKDTTTKHLEINNDETNRYAIIHTYHGNYDNVPYTLLSWYPDITNEKWVSVYRFGKNSDNYNCGDMYFRYNSDGNSTNMLTLGVRGEHRTVFQILGNGQVRCRYYDFPLNGVDAMQLLYEDWRFNNGEELAYSIKDNRANFKLLYKRFNNTNIGQIGFYNKSAQIYFNDTGTASNDYLSILFAADGTEQYKFYNDRAEFNQDLNINDGLLSVICSTAHKIYQKLEYNSTFTNNEYIRFQINDDTKQAMMDFVKTSEGYKLMLYIFMSLAGITITESSVDLLGQVNVSSDLYIRNNLYVDHIYSNNQLYIDVNNSFRLFSDFWLDNQSISQICISSDYANNQKIGDNALITSQAVKNAIAAIPTPPNLFDKIDEGEWTHILPDEGYYCFALYSITRDKYFIFRKDSALMYVSSDGEHDWTSEALPAAVDNNNIACLSLDDTIYYYNGLQLYKNTHYGSGWQSASVSLTLDSPTLCALNDFLILAGGDSNTTQSIYRYNRNNSNWTGISFERGARRFCASGSDRVVSIEANTSSTQMTIRWTFDGYHWYGSSIAHSQHTSCFAYGNSGGVGCWVAGTHSGGGRCTCIWWDSPLANTPSYAAFDKPAAGEVESIIYNAGVWIMYIKGDANYYYNRSPIPCYGTWEHATADNSHVDTRAFWCKNKFILLEDSNYTDEYNITYIDPIYQLNTTAAITAQNLSVDNETRLARLEAQMSNIMMATLQTIYPVGAIYTSMNPRSPEFLFGFGTWTAINNKFLFCLDQSNGFTDPTNNQTKNNSGQTGGESTHTLISAEMPVHNHGINGQCVNPGAGTWSDYGNYPVRLANDVGYNWSVISGLYSTNAGGLNNVTQSHNNIPPFMTIFAWQRTA